MITDKEMQSLGFRKIKSYRKRINGVSSFVWELDGVELSIERDDYGVFKPVLRIARAVRSFNDISEVKRFLEAIGWLND